jgi:hypothetical protein
MAEKYRLAMIPRSDEIDKGSQIPGRNVVTLPTVALRISKAAAV